VGFESFGLMDDTVVYPGRDENGWDADAESFEVEVNPCLCLTCFSIRVRDILERRGMVIVKTSVFVISQKEGGRVPRAGVAKFLVHSLDERLSE